MQMTRNKKALIYLAVIVIVIAGGTLVWAKVLPIINQPCSQPLQYSLGTFDPQFGISQTDFLNDVAAAEKIWEQPSGKNLFEYSPGAALKINLIYDSRQQATDKLKSLGYTIENTQSSYDSLKTRYDSLIQQYNTLKASLDNRTQIFETQKASYDAEVASWNSQGGAPPIPAQRLKNEYVQLSAQADEINKEKDQINALVNQINPLVSILNNLAADLKLNVTSYNTIGSSRGGEFEEGAYVQDQSGHHIDVYEFSSNDQLIRLLAHEMGHSLGLQHVSDPTAIMYRLNQSQNNVATAADLAELDRVCHLN